MKLHSNSLAVFTLLFVMVETKVVVKRYKKVSSSDDEFVCAADFGGVTKMFEKKVGVREGTRGKDVVRGAGYDSDAQCISACKEPFDCNNIQLIHTSPTQVECFFFSTFQTLHPSPSPCSYFTKIGVFFIIFTI